MLAAHLVLNWERYCPKSGFDAESFDAAAAEVVKAAQANVRAKILHSIFYWTVLRLLIALCYKPLRWAIRSTRVEAVMNRFTASGCLESHFSKHLFGDKVLSALADDDLAAGNPKPGGRPLLWILATNSSVSGLCFFSHRGFSPKADEPGTAFGSQEIPVARAVAASAAFPGFFSAIPFVSGADSPIVTKPFRLTEHLTVDAGVRDNLGSEGLAALQAYSQEKFKTVPGVLIVSDATGRVKFDLKHRLGFALGTARRAIDLQTVRLVELQRAELTGIKESFSQTLAVVSIDHQQEVITPPEIQELLATLRTDFDLFKNEEASYLVLYGYEVMRRQFKQALSIDSDSTRKLTSCAGLKVDQAVKNSKRSKRIIGAGGNRKLWLFDWRLRRSLLHAPVAIALVAFSLWAYMAYTKAGAQSILATAHNAARVDRWRQLVSSLLVRDPWVLRASIPPVHEVPQQDGSEFSNVVLRKFQRTADLRAWRDLHGVAEGGISEAGSAQTVYDRIVFRKQRAASTVGIPFMTNGSDVHFSATPGFRSWVNVDKPSDDPGKIGAARRCTLVLKIDHIAVGADFEVSYAVTFMNGLQEKDKTFVGLPIWCDEQESSIVVIWPDAKKRPVPQRKLSNLSDPETDLDSSLPARDQFYSDPMLPFSAWHVPSNEVDPAHVLKLNWSWPVR